MFSPNLEDTSCQPRPPPYLLPSGARARHGVTRTRSVINSGSAGLVNRHSRLGRCRRRVAHRIRDLERDRINTSIQISVTLGAELHRLTVRRNHDVVESVPVSATQIVLKLIAADAGYHHAAREIAVAARGSAGNEICHVECL